LIGLHDKTTAKQPGAWDVGGEHRQAVTDAITPVRDERNDHFTL
jgi:hypothetical protein